MPAETYASFLRSRYPSRGRGSNDSEKTRQAYDRYVSDYNTSNAATSSAPAVAPNPTEPASRAKPATGSTTTGSRATTNKAPTVKGGAFMTRTRRARAGLGTQSLMGGSSQMGYG